MPRIRAIIFDMDGVLIDAREWHYKALNRALGLFGFSIDRFDHLVTYDGLPTRKKLEMLSLDSGLPRKLHGLINDLKQKYTLEIVYGECRPVFRHQYALARLREEGRRLVVASNSVRATVDMMMERAALAPYLEFTLSNQDVQRAKPDPDIYLTALKRLALPAPECLVVEDNPHGIAAAQAAGIPLLAIPSPDYLSYERIAARIVELEQVV